MAKIYRILAAFSRLARLLYTQIMALSSGRKNVLVMGGAGFIGSHLCEALVQHANVICVDNFSTSTPASLQSLLQNPHFELIRHDITEPLDLTAHHELDRFHVRVHGVQEIYHLACPVSKSSYNQYRLALLKTQSVGMMQVMDLAVHYKAKVVFGSTSALYEPADEPYIPEDARCWNAHLGAGAAYDEGKRFSETILQTYVDIHGLSAKIVRLFRAYGPRMPLREGNLLPEIINAALTHQDLELSYSEDARFSLCYVTDVVDGLLKTMAHGSDARIMNIGSDQEVRLGMVVERIQQLTGSQARIRFQSSGKKYVSPIPNIDKARQLLHWLPLTRLDDGLKQMIDYSRSKSHTLTEFGM